MINSATGQAVGILLPFWSYLPTDKVSPKGFLYPVSQVMKEGDVLRFVVLIGEAEDEAPLAGKDFFWQDVKRMFRPKFFCADITALFKGRICNFTGVYAQKSGLYFNGRPAGKFEDAGDIFAYYGLQEVWNLITGDIKPSCCVYKYRRLFVPETEVCLGLVSEKANFPKGYDMKDLARVEKLLEEAGAYKIPEEISLAEVEKKLSKFAEIEKFLDEFSSDRETLLR